MTALGLQRVKLLLPVKRFDRGTSSRPGVCAMHLGLASRKHGPSQDGRCPPRHECAFLLTTLRCKGDRVLLCTNAECWLCRRDV